MLRGKKAHASHSEKSVDSRKDKDRKKFEHTGTVVEGSGIGESVGRTESGTEARRSSVVSKGADDSFASVPSGKLSAPAESHRSSANIKQRCDVCKVVLPAAIPGCFTKACKGCNSGIEVTVEAQDGGRLELVRALNQEKEKMETLMATLEGLVDKELLRYLGDMPALQRAQRHIGRWSTWYGELIYFYTCRRLSSSRYRVFLSGRG